MNIVGKIKNTVIWILAILVFVSSISGLLMPAPNAYAASSGSGSIYEYETVNGSLVICELPSTSTTRQGCSSNTSSQDTVFKYSSGDNFTCSGGPNCSLDSGKTSTITLTKNSSCSNGTLNTSSSTLGSAGSGRFGSYTPTSTSSSINIVNTKTLTTNNPGLNCTNSKLTGQAALASNTPVQTSNTPTCEEGGALDWVYCAVYTSLTDITQTVLQDFIMPELQTSPICISSTGSGCLTKNDPTFAIWSSFRLYGDIILVIALLVVVISEAAGGGLIDAYSVRKMLPRILAAGILLNLSIYIVAALIDVTNIIGGSIGRVITAPLKGAGAFKIQSNGTVGLVLIGSFSIIALMSLKHLGGLFTKPKSSSSLIDMILVPALLIFLAILITIIIRKIAILSLVIFSPLAFAFFCLPNTQKYFKRWWDLLLEMLMVYPIIVAIFALSSVMSVVTDLPGSGGSGFQGSINALLVLALTIIPLVLIPFSFKLAGDTIGRVYDGVSGAKERISKMHEPRRKRSQEAYHRAVLGSRQGMHGMLENNRVAGLLKRVPVIGNRLNVNSERAQTDVMIAAGELGNKPEIKAHEHDEVTLHAMLNRGNFNDTVDSILRSYKRTDPNINLEDPEVRARAEREARVGITSAKNITGNSLGAVESVYAARQLAIIATGYATAEDMEKAVADAAGGSERLRGSLAGDLNSISKQVGRSGLSPGAGQVKKGADLFERIRRGEVVDQLELNELYNKNTKGGWSAVTPAAHATERPEELRRYVQYYTEALDSDNLDEQDEAIAFFKELPTVKTYATGDVRDIAAKALDDYQGVINSKLVKYDDGPPQYDSSGARQVRPDYIGDDRVSRINNRVRSAYDQERLSSMGIAPSAGPTPPGAGPTPPGAH